MTTALITVAVLIVLALAGYAGWLQYRLWQRGKRQRATPAVETFDPGAGGGRRVALRKTLYVLSDALINEKMTHTEGCLRICAMANNLEEREQFRREYVFLSPNKYIDDYINIMSPAG